MRRNPRIERLLDEAQRERRCAIGRTDADRRALFRRIPTGDLISPYRNLYARPAYWGTLTVKQRAVHVARALALMHANWIFAGLTAATIHGFDHSNRLHDGTVFIASPRATQPCDSGRLRRIRMGDPGTVMVDGLTVTDPARTLVDCGNAFPFAEALPFFDSAMRQGVAIDDVKIACADCGSLDIDRARIARLCEHADGLSENGGESKLRALMIDNGFLKPQLQRQFANPDNPLGPYRTDYSWDLQSGIIVGEYDGMAKYVMPQSGGYRSIQSSVHAERRREDHLRAQGVRTIVRFEFEDILNPLSLIRKLIEAGVPRSGQ